MFRSPINSVLNVALAAATLCGCARLDVPVSPIEAVTSGGRGRQAQLIAQYERGRDETQYRAALASWQRGDASACLESVDQLLARSPNHYDARLLAAEIFLQRGETDHAACHIEAVLAATPDHPAALHARGLLLASQGDLDSALDCHRCAGEDSLFGF